MTFQAYHRTRTRGLSSRDVCRDEPTAKARNSGDFESESVFLEAFMKIFGTTPSLPPDGAGLFMERIETPLGIMLAAADDEGLRLLEFGDHRALERELPLLHQRLKVNVAPGKHPHLDATRAQLVRYFSGENLAFDLPLAPIGSDFQMRAWEILCSIPLAETRSYSWMADKLGIPGARRAVGRANGTNMISIIIPCHRVIRADGSLCGYGGGLWRKKWLLDHEQRFARRKRARGDSNTRPTD